MARKVVKVDKSAKIVYNSYVNRDFLKYHFERSTIVDNKDMLKVEVNLAGRVCVISDSNGTVLLRKPITEAMYSICS